MYGYGDRDKGVGYKILNWQVENTSVRGKWSGGFKHVGFWSTDHGLQVRPSPILAYYRPLPMVLHHGHNASRLTADGTVTIRSCFHPILSHLCPPPLTPLRQLCDPNTPAWYTPASKTAAL